MEDSNPQSDLEEMEKLIPFQIEEVKVLLRDKHGLEVPPGCDGFIARCLRSKDGALDKAIKLIISYRKTVVDFKSWDASLQPSLYEDLYNSYAIVPLLQRDRKGRRLLSVRCHMWDPEKMNFDELILASWMTTQHLSKEFADVQRSGFAVIFDFSKFSLQHAWAVKHWRLLSLAKWAQNGVIGRFKGIHMVFHFRVIRAIYAAIRPFLKEKLKRRIWFHDNLDSLHQHVDPQGLPKYLGGELEPFSDDCIDKHFIKELLLQDSYFKDIAANQFPCQ